MPFSSVAISSTKDHETNDADDHEDGNNLLTRMETTRIITGMEITRGTRMITRTGSRMNLRVKLATFMRQKKTKETLCYPQY